MNIQNKKNYFIDSFKDNEDEKAIIDPTFRSVVVTHIVGNYMKNVNMPLFLAIQGNPGEGKTFQTLNICKQSGVKVCYISGAELSGNYEKDSILDLQDNYIRASNFYISKREPCVIIIDDFHLSPASTKNGVGTTINSQILTGYLMNLCDRAKNTDEDRVPIILIGNSFKDIYEPLKRDGRMDFFTWEAPIEQKYKIAYSLFNNMLPKKDLRYLTNFVNEFKKQPVAFFKELKNDILKEKIRYICSKKDKVNVIKYIDEFNQINSYNVDIKYLYELANKRVNSKTAYSYEEN